jgi:pyruvate,water dikinase
MIPGSVTSSVLRASIVALGALCAASSGCSGGGDADAGTTWECVIPEADGGPDGGAGPEFSAQIGCKEDFEKLSAAPMSAAISGARSVKTVIDQADGDAMYFQNTELYPIHYDFCSTHLSGPPPLPYITDLGTFNATEYYSPQRRFLLGALTYYQGPDVWVYEIAPYDASTAEMIEKGFFIIKSNIYIGDDLYFHPTSEAVQAEAEKLPDTIPIITNDELYAGIDYQPLNLGMSMGQLRFREASQLDVDYLSFRDIVVLDKVPNDISVCSGIITDEFQTPLSHVNVLSQNRGTPNMGLKGAFSNEDLRALEGEWVRFEVDDFDYSVVEVTKEEADAWWEEHKPSEVQVPNLDLTVTGLWDVEEIMNLEEDTLGEALDEAIPAFGGKASHFAAFPHIVDGDGNRQIPFPKAFAVPVHYYWDFMEQNGLFDYVDDMLADEEFQNDPAVRDQRLAELRDAIQSAPVDLAFAKMLIDKMEAEYPDTPCRFRSSTNAEDLDGFTGAGLYESHTGTAGDPEYPIMDAVRGTWAATWRFKAFEERAYRSIDHTQVGMALLVHRSFPDEEANGVAITANIFDTQGLEPGHYVNAQKGGISVVLPDPNVTSDQLLIYYANPGLPIVYLAHSNLVPDDETVLTRDQILELSGKLGIIHNFFAGEYGPEEPGDFYGMDVEFKFEDELIDADNSLGLVIKQARPYPGWNSNGGE